MNHEHQRTRRSHERETKRARRRRTGEALSPGRGDPERITAESIDFEALAHMLANTCRRGGRLRRYHSFAAHGVAMSEAIEDLAATEGGDVREAALLALLHEAAVAWLGPDAAPAQRSTPRLRRLGEKTDRAVREAAGLGAKPDSGPAELVRFVARMADAAEERGRTGSGRERVPAPRFPADREKDQVPGPGPRGSTLARAAERAQEDDRYGMRHRRARK